MNLFQSIEYNVVFDMKINENDKIFEPFRKYLSIMNKIDYRIVGRDEKESYKMARNKDKHLINFIDLIIENGFELVLSELDKEYERFLEWKKRELDRKLHTFSYSQPKPKGYKPPEKIEIKEEPSIFKLIKKDN